jgi:hypothetical protein
VTSSSTSSSPDGRTRRSGGPGQLAGDDGDVHGRTPSEQVGAPSGEVSPILRRGCDSRWGRASRDERASLRERVEALACVREGRVGVEDPGEELPRPRHVAQPARTWRPARTRGAGGAPGGCGRPPVPPTGSGCRPTRRHDPPWRRRARSSPR